MDVRELEGIAAYILGETGLDDPPVDAIELAGLLGVEVRWGPRGRNLCRGMQVVVGAEARVARIHGSICHELAHILIDRFGLRQSERAANYLAAALLVPRRALDRELRDGWDLERLRCKHIYASAELLARRIVDIRSAALSVYDQGRFRYRAGPPGLPIERERSLVDAALERGAPVREDALTGAWPVIDGHFRRVLVLAA